MSRYFSDTGAGFGGIRPGSRLGSLSKNPGRVEVVLFCSAIRNFHRLHYDETYTRAQGMKDILVPGFLMGNWCLELVTRSFPQGSLVRRLKFKNTAPAHADDTFAVTGEVEGVEGADGNTVFRCTVRVTDPDGRLVTTGEVDVECPSSIVG